MTVALAQPDDVSALARLAAATFPLACPPHITRRAIAAFIAENLSDDSFAGYLRDPACDVLIARDGRADDPTGYALAIRRAPSPDIAALLPEGAVTEISKLYVRGDAQGTGAGRALLGTVLDRARERAPIVWLGTNEHNAGARGFYERSGFSLVGTRRFLVGGRWEDDVVYAREA